jgi:hypothetical protein
MDPHSFANLHPDPHTLKSWDPDPRKVLYMVVPFVGLFARFHSPDKIESIMKTKTDVRT